MEPKRRPREHLQCTECGWDGVTARGVIRRAVYVLGLVAIVALVVLELLDVIALGDQLIALAITIMLLSIGLRLLIRGDRCRECGAQAVYIKRPRVGQNGTDSQQLRKP